MANSDALSPDPFDSTFDAISAPLFWSRCSSIHDTMNSNNLTLADELFLSQWHLRLSTRNLWLIILLMHQTLFSILRNRQPTPPHIRHRICWRAISPRRLEPCRGP